MLNLDQMLNSKLPIFAFLKPFSPDSHAFFAFFTNSVLLIVSHLSIPAFRLLKVSENLGAKMLNDGDA